MAIRLVVFDFDGTLTDIAAEGAQFAAAYEARIARLFGADRLGAWREAVVAVGAEAPELGWDMGSGATAPGDADPYITATLALARFCTALDLPILAGNGEKALKTRGELGGALYQAAYGDIVTTFRREARDVVEAAVRAVDHVRIVTNSSTAKVTEKVRGLRLPLPLGVAGDARKFEVGEPTRRGRGIGGVPATWAVSGLQRPILPRRGRYFDVLSEVWDDTGVSPAETLVVGDIVELDLVLPGLLGAHVHYVERARSHAYEAAILGAFGARAERSASLDAVLDRLD